MRVCYSMKHLRKLIRRIPILVAALGVYFLYKQSVTSETPTQTKRLRGTPAAPDVSPPPTDSAPDSASHSPWVLTLADRDLCLSVVTAFSGWTVLLAGDVREPDPTLRHSRCIYLGASVTRSQKFSRRQQALLYAVQHGADAVYILPPSDGTEDVSYPTGWRLTTTVTALVADSAVFSPVSHWGCNATSSKADRPRYWVCTVRTPAIQTTAVQLTGSHDLAADLCDPASPSVILSPATLGYAAPEGTLYLQTAFWAAGLEGATDRERSHLGLLAHRLLTLTGGHLMVRLGDRVPAPDSVTRDLDYIRTVTCQTGDFTQCLREAVRRSQELRYISTQTLTNINSWVDRLQELLGADRPTDDHLECLDSDILYTPVDHHVSYKIQKWRPRPFPPINNVAEISRLHQELCGEFPSDVDMDFLSPWTQQEDVLLIVVFNNPLYDVIPLTEVLYRSFFPNILYCGPEHTDNITALAQRFNISFVSYGRTPAGHFPGAFNYRCLSLAVAMGYQVAGYLSIADDLLLVPGKLNKLHTEKVWYIPKGEIRTADIAALRECRLGMCDFHTRWRWWEDYQDATLNALQKLSSSSDALLRQCADKLAATNQGRHNPNGAYSDIYYVPSHLAGEFGDLAELFLRHYVFLEIAVPTILNCLVPAFDDIESLLGKQIWDLTRNESWVYFTKRDLVYKSYLHPTKWSYVGRQGVGDKYREFFCHAVSFLHDPYGRIPKVPGE